MAQNDTMTMTIGNCFPSLFSARDSLHTFQFALKFKHLNVLLLFTVLFSGGSYTLIYSPGGSPLVCHRHNWNFFIKRRVFLLQILKIFFLNCTYKSPHSWPKNADLCAQYFIWKNATKEQTKEVWMTLAILCNGFQAVRNMASQYDCRLWYTEELMIGSMTTKCPGKPSRTTHNHAWQVVKGFCADMLDLVFS